MVRGIQRIQEYPIELSSRTQTSPFLLSQRVCLKLTVLLPPKAPSLFASFGTTVGLDSLTFAI